MEKLLTKEKSKLAARIEQLKFDAKKKDIELQKILENLEIQVKLSKKIQEELKQEKMKVGRLEEQLSNKLKHNKQMATQAQKLWTSSEDKPQNSKTDELDEATQTKLLKQRPNNWKIYSKLLEYNFVQECDARVLEGKLAEEEMQEVRAMQQNQLETNQKLVERNELEKAELCKLYSKKPF